MYGHDLLAEMYCFNLKCIYDMTGMYCFNLKGIYDMMAEMYCFGGGGCGGGGGGGVITNPSVPEEIY